MVVTNKGILALEDGTIYQGVLYGGQQAASGEVVFNTSLTGYQEVLTDPSYCGQIVCMTYPLIGNYGMTADDCESDRIQVEGFIVRDVCEFPSNWRSQETLNNQLAQSGVPCLAGIDTRSLVKRLREAGVMRGFIGSESDFSRAYEQATQVPGMAGQELVSRVTTDQPYFWDANKGRVSERPEGQFQRHIVVYDFGVKYNILRSLAGRENLVEVLPAQTSAEDLLARKPDGVMLSNGPGDPEVVDFAIKNVQDLIGRVPLFGICLGHQILGCAIGAGTYKLKFGHRGGNQPVRDHRGGKVFISSQNHGFCVNGDKVDPAQAEITLVNLNDQTVEGLANREAGWFSVQYHPEACPGPHDASTLFDQFMELIDRGV